MTNKLKKVFCIMEIIVLLIVGILVVDKKLVNAGNKNISIKLNYSTVVLYNKGKKKVKLHVKKKGIRDKVKWKSNRKTIASVSSSGKVTAKKVGTAIITASCGGKKAKCKIVVKDYAKEYSASINAFKKFLEKGYSYTNVNGKYQKVVFENWQLADIGDGSIKELIVRVKTEKENRSYVIFYEYYNGKIVDIGKKTFIQGRSDDKQTIVLNWHMYQTEKEPLFYDKDSKQIVSFGKQTISTITVENGCCISDAWYDMRAWDYQLLFYDSENDEQVRLYWHDNTEVMREKYLQ